LFVASQQTLVCARETRPVIDIVVEVLFWLAELVAWLVEFIRRPSRS
jgi:hypothetical protein